MDNSGKFRTWLPGKWEKPSPSQLVKPVVLPCSPYTGAPPGGGRNLTPAELGEEAGRGWSPKVSSERVCVRWRRAVQSSLGRKREALPQSLWITLAG